jgi:hypothetical protein
MKQKCVWLVILAFLLILPGLVLAEESMLVIPPEGTLNAGDIPEGVKTVFLPAGTELGQPEALKQEIIVYSYKDYDMIHKSSSVMYYDAAVEPGEYALADAKRFLPGGESETLQQEYYEYPVELNGRKLYNCLMKRDYYILYRNSGCDYYRISDTEIGVCKYLGAGKTVTIPEQIDGMTVVALNSLDSNWIIFGGKTQKVTFPSTIRLFGNYVVYTKLVSSVKIPDSVTELGSYAIKGDRISKVDIPAGVKAIGVNAIDTKMKALKLPATVEKLSERAFTNSKYSTISLPAGLREVPRDLCLNSRKLTKVDIPESVIRIGENAFKGCAKITSVTIPAEVTEIAAGAFSGCANLKTVLFKGGGVKKVEEETFAGCGFGKLVPPDGVEEISRRAFAGCARLTSVELPDSVATIGEGAFIDCTKLRNVRLTENVKQIADDAFDNCGKGITFTVPEGSYARQWAESKGFTVKIAKKK